MKRCIYCLSECGDDAQSCPVCGFNENAKKEHESCLPVGTKLGNRYLLGGVSAKDRAFVTYYGLDCQTRKRVKIAEYLHEKLVYRHPGELIIKFRDEKSFARADKEIAAFYAHYQKLCTVSKTSILNFTDCFAENATIYVVSPIVTGTPLSSLMGNGKAMPFLSAVSLLKPVIECSVQLEKIGKWHGSLSPYSVITEKGKVTALTGYSYPPKSLYSPFDAPEKQLGAKECGSFTDVYAIGAMLYEASTGFLPPQGENKKLSFPSDFPEHAREVIEKSMSLDKTERYQTVSELFAAIKGEKAAKEKLPRAEIIRRITLAVASLCLVISSGVLINHYILEPLKESKQASQLASMIQTTLEDNRNDPWKEIQQKYPDVDFPAEMNPAFADLYALNRDFAGWISIPEMGINFSVVQGDDNKYYERRDFYGKSTSYGVPFFDYRNSLKTLDRNTIIYGHNMRHDDKIFGTLEQYRTVEGFAKAPLIGMSTIYGDYTFKIYAVFISNSKSEDNNGDIFNYIFTTASSENFNNYIREVDKRKLYSTGVDINENDRILTLSTCCYDFTDARLVVVGRLLRAGESPAVDTSLAKENPNPKFPQAYYDAKGKENPYINDPNVFNH